MTDGLGNSELVVTGVEGQGDTTGLGIGNPAPSLVGTLYKQNGRTYRIVTVPEGDMAFKPPVGLSEEDELQFRTMMRAADLAREAISEMGFRLYDAQDGKTFEGFSLLAKGIDCLLPKERELVGHFILGQYHNGATLHDKLGAVLVPPCSREKFEGFINQLNPDLSSDFDWESWLDHVYNPIPLYTQGVYLFNTDEDLKRFHEGLKTSSPEYGDWCNKVREFFDSALQRGDLTQEEWAEYHELSQKIGEEQVKKINEVLENDVAAKGLSTRVKFSIDPDGVFSWETVHFLDEFSAEWERVVQATEKALGEAPTWASELQDVMRATIEWIRTPNRDVDWGRTNGTWVRANDSACVLNWLITSEEVQTHIGQKGFPHIAIAQYHHDIPEQLSETLKLLFDSAHRLNVNPVLLRTLIVGGSNEHGVLLGENLPDEGSPRKSMTFMNTCGTVLIAPNFAQIAACLGRDVKDVEKLKDLGGLQVAFHEYGHNLGGLAKHLKQHSSPTEEVNAQACAAYIAARYMEDPTDVIEIASLWTPIRRAFQGPTEQHSKSDIYLIGRYLEVGAVEIRTEGDKTYFHLADRDLLAQTAFDEAIKMRLWEAGVPSEYHSKFQEPLDFTPGEAQDFRIKDSIETFLRENEESIQVWQEKCFEEAEATFKSEEMNRIASKLKPIMDSCPTEQTLSFFPSRPEVRALFGFAG